MPPPDDPYAFLRAQAEAAIKAEEDSVEVIRTDTNPASLTHYLKIGISNEKNDGAPKVLGVYVPAKFKPQSQVDVLVYFHGHKWTMENGKQTWHTDWAIEQIWSHPTFPLREGLNASGRQFVLVAPTLGATDQYGDWDTDAYFHLSQ